MISAPRLSSAQRNLLDSCRAAVVVAAVLCVGNVADRSACAAEPRILTNHLGYEPAAPKVAVVLAHEDDELGAFKVLSSDWNELFAGDAKKIGRVDQWRDYVFWTLDLSPVRQEGNCTIQCATKYGAIRSFPFAIQKELLERSTLSNLIYYFKGQRIAGQRDKADHHLKFEDSTDPNRTLDLHGGWADATGDYGKHLSHLSFSTYFNPQHIPLTTWAMFKAHQQLSRRGGDNFTLYKQRLLDEALFGADYLCRSKSPTGSFFRSVDDPGNPEKRFVAKDGSGGIIKKTKNPNPLQAGDMSSISENFLYEIGFRSGGGVSVAALALASTYPASGEYTSAQYLQAAKDAYVFLQKYNQYYTNDGQENIVDDYCILLAATELFNATKEDKYKIDAVTRAKNLLARLTDKGYWRADDGDRPFFHAADAGLPAVALLNFYPIADDTLQKEILTALKKSLQHEINVTREAPNPFGYARQFVQHKSGERETVFFFPPDSGAAPWWQGENARLGSLASAARMAAPYFKDDPKFHDELEAFAWNQLNWILGSNPFDCCMLHGTGRNNLYYKVGNSYAYTPAPGGICNGITAGFTDPHNIDFAPSDRNDDGWRWAEQWLPHATWFLYAVCEGSQ
jgi:hypothetical protein